MSITCECLIRRCIVMHFRSNSARYLNDFRQAIRLWVRVREKMIARKAKEDGQQTENKQNCLIWLLNRRMSWLVVMVERAHFEFVF